MSEIETAFCRFCAKSKPYGKLIDLQTDEERRRKVVENLFRLSLEVVKLNSPHDALPKTVCFPCMESLENVCEFILNVEASQNELIALGVFDVKHDEITICYEEISPKPVQKDVIVNFDIAHVSERVKDEDGNKTETETDNHGLENNLLAEELAIIKTDKEIGEKSVVEKVKVKSEKQTVTNISEKTLVTDAQASWKDCIWLCCYCDVKFSRIDELKQHSMQSHDCCNPYRCIDCKMRIFKLDTFVTHIKQHRHDLRLSCYRCHKTFLRLYDVYMHKKDHVSTEHTCPGCNENFATKELCIEHCKKYKRDKKTRHVPPELLTKDLKCLFCHKQFRYRGGLTTHLLTQHREQKRDYKCDLCGKCYVNKANLTVHILMHDNIRPYKCGICNHRFRLQIHLTRHMGTHNSNKPFVCENCGRCFRLKKQLSAHSIVHTEKSPHTCSYCKKSFKHKSTHVQHLRIHTGERPYKCHLCSNGFTNCSNYNKHMKRHHGINMAKRQQPLNTLMDPTMPDVELVATDLSIHNRNKFVPRRPGRPKKNKSIMKIISANEIKTE